MEAGKGMRRVSLAISLAALLLALCAVAQAASVYVDPARSNFYVKVGAAFLIGEVPNAIQPTGGIGYEWPISSASRCSTGRTVLGFSLDYIPVKSEVPKDRTVNTIPELFYVKRTALFGAYNTWGEIGVGARWSSRSLDDMHLHTDQNPAWMFGGGVDFTTNLFAEARFIAGWHPGDDGLFTTDIGYRF